MRKCYAKQSVNDHLIEEILEDSRYKIFPNGKIMTCLTLNGQGISDEWREMGYQKPDGYVRIRYKDNFLFVHRIIYRKYNGPLDSAMTIDHKDKDRTNNHKSNLIQKSQGENNKNKSKKYNKKGRVMKISRERLLEKTFQKLSAKTDEEWQEVFDKAMEIKKKLDEKLEFLQAAPKSQRKLKDYQKDLKLVKMNLDVLEEELVEYSKKHATSLED